MGNRLKYRKKSGQFVIAVQLNLETDGFDYQKWGDRQRCKPGDWLVNNQGDTYTVDQETFQKTYRKKSPGIFVKESSIWAERTTRAGKVETKEGISHYLPGDYLVSNSEDGSDTYCVTAEKFESMYEPDE